jgi:hypothetical protein
MGMQFLEAIGAVTLFAAWFCFVCYLISRIGGWTALARKYRATVAPEGRQFSFQSAHIGGARYKFMPRRIRGSNWPVFKSVSALSLWSSACLDSVVRT